MTDIPEGQVGARHRSIIGKDDRVITAVPRPRAIGQLTVRPHAIALWEMLRRGTAFVN